MSYCPYCGGQVQEAEHYCISCGKKLPTDIHNRKLPGKPSKKRWIFPLIILVLSMITISAVYFYTNYRTDKAVMNYEKAQEMALIGDYHKAEKLLLESISYKDNFPAAQQVLEFVQVAQEAEDTFTAVDELNKENRFSDSFQYIQQVDDSLQNFSGDLVNKVAERAQEIKNRTLLFEATYKLNNEPTITSLQSLMWEIEEISHEQVPEIKGEIREKLISLTYETATDLFNNLQYNQALKIIDDTLSVIESAEQLESLKTTIYKEKTTFESEQEKRIEQALSASEKDNEINKNDALELININLQKSRSKWQVSGKLKSIATVPIHSILVHYSIIDASGNTLLENSVYAYPETLYPEEEGNFAFTHYELPETTDRLSVKVDEIKWYLE